MGGHEEWPQLSGLLPNESALSIRVLDSERWSKAEDKIAELIGCIQPNQPSEERRNAVADYVQRLILKCFPCKVFTFGSVPLKTYLPDGDIDLTAFSKNQSLKDTWASQVRDILESEEKNENAEFHVKEVQYIQAEVKIIKCLVENIVVDISFNQLGGLCTLCFLEEVDHLINQDHLFKRSIILIKAWCYYESRILGAHHGLISTYALETLVLYIFHVFNNSFTGPLEVLYRFLEFFSNFDWDNFCVSLWGPVPIGSLPDGKAEPPRKDGGELLLSKLFLEACSSVYAVFPGGQENQGQPFISKHFNVIDPLREKNNLGRSVSKGNFYRIRSAFAFGAKRLARLVDCPEENIVFELNQFFMNTWERHGSGIRPDVPIIDSCPLSSINPDDRSNSQENASISNHANNNASSQENEIDVLHSTPTLSSQRASYPQESISKSNDVPAVSCMPGQKSFGNPRSSRNSEQAGKGHSVQSVQIDRNQRSLKPDHLVNEVQGKYLFARTRSSPELTDAYYDTSSRGRRNKPAESGRSQAASKMDSNRRKNVASETVSIQSTVSSSDDLSSERQSSSHQIVDAAADSNSVSNSVVDDSGTGIVSEDHSSVMGAQGMHQEEQDLVNMMASSSLHSFGGQVPMPLNMASNHLPLPISQSVLASMGYGQRNMAGMIPSNFPLIDPQWAANLQFQQGLISSPLTQYFPGVGLSTNSEDLSDQGDENFGSVEYWHERDVASSGGVHQNDASVETFYADDRQPSTSGNSSFVPSSRAASSESSLKAQARSSIELGTSMRDDCVETFQRHDNRLKDDDRVSSARFSSAPQGGSVRTKTSSESSWDGSSARVSKVAREKRGKKPGASAAVPPTFYGKDKDMHEHASADLDDETRDWNTMSTTGNESDDISTGSQHASTLHVHPRNHMPSFEVAQTSGSDSVIPMAPMLLGPSSRQRVVDNSGVVPFTFYPTGPPVPFFTMLHFPPEAGTSDSSGISLRGEENPENIESGRSISFSVGHDAPDVLNTYNSLRMTPTVASEEPKSDILNSDFASHWQNLQFGRFCQGPRLPAPVICPSPVVVPPMYLQGRFPWEGPGRPVAANGNLLSQLMSYGPRLVPVAPPQPASSRPPTAYPRYTDELPRYRGGTGTYLPNPKASVRERHSSGGRRNNYNYDRSDHGDREGNWNVAKARAAGRSHNRNQAEKSRIDRLPGNDGRADRPWSTYRPDQISSYQAQNGPSRPSSSQGSSANVAYGMYPMPGMNPGGVTSNGPVVMLYPYDHNSGYASPGEQLEFGSLGPMGVGTNEASPIDGTRLRRAFEDQRFHGSSGQQSSPDQPSSPHFQRSVAQMTYRLKDEDFPPLVFQSAGQDGGRIYNENRSYHHSLMFAPQA